MADIAPYRNSLQSLLFSKGSLPVEIVSQLESDARADPPNSGDTVLGGLGLAAATAGVFLAHKECRHIDFANKMNRRLFVFGGFVSGFEVANSLREGQNILRQYTEIKVENGSKYFSALVYGRNVLTNDEYSKLKAQIVALI